jgi:hypothetical protein
MVRCGYPRSLLSFGHPGFVLGRDHAFALGNKTIVGVCGLVRFGEMMPPVA